MVLKKKEESEAERRDCHEAKKKQFAVSLTAAVCKGWVWEKLNLKDKKAQALELSVKAVTGKVGELTGKER